MAGTQLRSIAGAREPCENHTDESTSRHSPINMTTVLEFDIHRDEAKRAYRHMQQSLLRGTGRNPVLKLLGLLAFVAIVGAAMTLTNVLASANAAQAQQFYYWLFAVLALWLGYRGVLATRVMSKWLSNDGLLVGRHVLSFDEQGISESRRTVESRVQWGAVTGIEDAEPGIFISIGAVMFYFVPRRVFASIGDAERFLEELHGFLPPDSSARGANSVSASSGTAVASSEPFRDADSASKLKNAAIALRTNLGSGLRLAFFLQVRETRLCATWSQLIVLVLAGATLGLATDMARVGLNGRLSISGLPGALFHVPVILIASWAIAMLARRTEKTLLLAVAVLAADLWIDVIGWAFAGVLHYLPRSPALSWTSAIQYYLPGIWLGLVAASAGIRLLGVSLPLRWVACILGIGLLTLPLTGIWVDRELWVQKADQNDLARRSAYYAAASEDVFYLQPKLLERELAAVVPGPSAKSNLYFVGLAGYADQDVFMREVNSVAKLLQDRFATSGRSVVLINNGKTLYQAPIATKTALRASLRRVAEVMDPDRDILFLFLTSHGSRDHKFSLQLWPLQLQDLDPAVLRQMLDETRIKNRIIVVSACYSGGFIDPLKNDNTLIITAAATDRNSFGCSNDADFTYFGKAYFDEALRATYSFTDAFNLAKPVILEREKSAGYDPSDPQIFIGKNLPGVLGELERELAFPAEEKGVATEAGRGPDRYAQFAALWVSQETFKLSYAQCRRAMAEDAPGQNLVKYPNYYGGSSPGSANWPRILAAYEQYANAYCQSVADVGLYRDVYAQAWRQSASEAEVSAFANMLATPLGRRFVAAVNHSTFELTGLWEEQTRTQRENAVRDYKDALSHLADDRAGDVEKR